MVRSLILAKYFISMFGKHSQDSMKEYLANPNKCKQCDRAILPRKKEKCCDVKIKKFCNSSCAASFNGRVYPKRSFSKRGIDPVKNCAYCLTPLKNRYSKYCNNTCHNKHIAVLYIERWKKGEESGIMGRCRISRHINHYLRIKHGNQCCKCGWKEINPKTQKVPLQVNHIDGHWDNNTEENLELLCPNCHSLTPTFGSLNRGNGRGKKRYSE